jgi:hypothetical protein
MDEESKNIYCHEECFLRRALSFVSHGFKKSNKASPGYVISLSEFSLGIMQGQFAELLMILGTGGNFG